MGSEDRLEWAAAAYERAVYTGDAMGLEAADRDLNAVEADLAVARGRIMHARFFDTSVVDAAELVLFERATQLYRLLGDEDGEAESLFWEACFHQVVGHDDASAVPILERSRDLAVRVNNLRTLSEVLRHLGIAAHREGRLDEAQEFLEESTRLRRELGLMAGVAANLVGLVYVAAAQGRRDDALELGNQARVTAKHAGADRILAQAEEAMASLDRP